MLACCLVSHKSFSSNNLRGVDQNPTNPGAEENHESL